MELAELIHSRTFLGGEFLTWLWFKTECYDGLFDVESIGTIEVAFDDRMTLEAYTAETKRNVIKGGEPAYSPEAKTALREGKRAQRAKLRIVESGREWSFRFKSEGFELTSVKTPTLRVDRDDEKFFGRMELLSDLESIIEALYDEFLTIRLSPAWEGRMVPAMRSWIEADRMMAIDDYPEGIVEQVRDADLPSFQEYAETEDEE